MLTLPLNSCYYIRTAKRHRRTGGVKTKPHTVRETIILCGPQRERRWFVPAVPQPPCVGVGERDVETDLFEKGWRPPADSDINSDQL